ncbi:MAG: hypothetical protein DI539_22740, partial [Flavobacterium psychrophilum]
MKKSINIERSMKRIIGGALLVLLMQTATAQETPIKDEQLKTLIQAAVTNYPRIKELEEQLKADDVKKEIIKAGYLPNASADINYTFIAPSPKVEFETPA